MIFFLTQKNQIFLCKSDFFQYKSGFLKLMCRWWPPNPCMFQC